MNYTIIAIIWFGSIRIDHGHMRRRPDGLIGMGLIFFHDDAVYDICHYPRAFKSLPGSIKLETECSIKDPLDTERSGAAGAFAGAGTAAHISTIRSC